MKRREFLKTCGVGGVLCGPIESYADECPNKEDTFESLCEEFGCTIRHFRTQAEHEWVWLWHDCGLVPIELKFFGELLPLREQFVIEIAKAAIVKRKSRYKPFGAGMASAR